MTGETPIRTFTLALTHRCNLRCDYCYQDHDRRGGPDMDIIMAQQIILGEFNHAAAGERIVFDFIGGEVFMVWPLFRRICEWLWSEERPAPYLINVTTNGTLLTREIKQWLTDNRDMVKPGLSWDGDSAMQNDNRHTAGYDIDVDFFLKTWPESGIKMTLSSKTIGRLSQALIQLHRAKGLGLEEASSRDLYSNRLACNIAYGVELTAANYWELKRELILLVDFYCGPGAAYRPATILDADLAGLAPLNPEEGNFKYCGCGKYMVCYDTDGQRYPCHFFLPLTMPRELLEKLPQFDLEKGRRDPVCANCVIEGVCPNCCGNNFKTNADPFIRDKRLCAFSKLIFLGNCVLQTKRLLRKAELAGEEVFTLKRIH